MSDTKAMFKCANTDRSIPKCTETCSQKLSYLVLESVGILLMTIVTLVGLGTSDGKSVQMWFGIMLIAWALLLSSFGITLSLIHI